MFVAAEMLHGSAVSASPTARSGPALCLNGPLGRHPTPDPIPRGLATNAPGQRGQLVLHMPLGPRPLRPFSTSLLRAQDGTRCVGFARDA